MLLTQKIVTTRKEHQCWGCAKHFPTGSKLWYVRSEERRVLFRSRVPGKMAADYLSQWVYRQTAH